MTVYNKGKRSKDTEVAELTVELSTLTNGDEVEEWYKFSGITPIGEWGSLRLRVRYLHDLIMPHDEYSPLQQLLLDPSLEVVRALADICHLDRIPLANSLLRIFRSAHTNFLFVNLLTYRSTLLKILLIHTQNGI